MRLQSHTPLENKQQTPKDKRNENHVHTDLGCTKRRQFYRKIISAINKMSDVLIGVP
jgi:hypothetical protein